MALKKRSGNWNRRPIGACDWVVLPSPRSRRRGRHSAADATAEHIPNLDALKTELREYHDCTCKCGCYAHDIDVQADRAIAFLRRRAAHRRPARETGADSGHRRDHAIELRGRGWRGLRLQRGRLRPVGRDGAGAGDSRHVAALQGSAAAGREHLLYYRPRRTAARRHGAQSARAGLRQLEAACDAPGRITARRRSARSRPWYAARLLPRATRWR